MTAKKSAAKSSAKTKAARAKARREAERAEHVRLTRQNSSVQRPVGVPVRVKGDGEYVRVKAIRTGYYDLSRIKEGTIFNYFKPEGEAKLPSWVRALKDQKHPAEPDELEDDVELIDEDNEDDTYEGEDNVGEEDEEESEEVL